MIDYEYKFLKSKVEPTQEQEKAIRSWKLYYYLQHRELQISHECSEGIKEQDEKTKSLFKSNYKSLKDGLIAFVDNGLIKSKNVARERYEYVLENLLTNDIAPIFTQDLKRYYV